MGERWDIGQRVRLRHDRQRRGVARVPEIAAPVRETLTSRFANFNQRLLQNYRQRSTPSRR